MEKKISSNPDDDISGCPICYDPKELVSKFCCSHKVCSECFMGQLKSKAELVCSQCRSDVCKNSLTKEENSIFENREEEKVPDIVGLAVQFLRDREYIFGESRDGPGAIPSWIFQNLVNEDNPSLEVETGIEVQPIRNGFRLVSNNDHIESIVNLCVRLDNAYRNINLDVVDPS
tara:strand:+ start:959 stop:1480 length:522 start_codon:yes stop_codon:yes gene_type:complete